MYSEPLRNVCKLFSMELVEHRQAYGQIALVPLIHVCQTVGTPVRILLLPRSFAEPLTS